MQCCLGRIDEALKKLVHQIHVEAADARAGILHPVLQARPAGEVDDYTGQSLVQGYVGVTVAGDAFLVAQGLGEALAENNADILNRVMGIDVQVATCLHLDIEQPVARHLVEHVLEKGHSGLKTALARAVEIQRHGNPRFPRFAFHRRLACRHVAPRSCCAKGV